MKGNIDQQTTLTGEVKLVLNEIALQLKDALVKNGDEIMNARQVAKYIGFSYDYVRKLVEEGEIPCKRVCVGDGKSPRLRFSRKKLDEWIQKEVSYIDPENAGTNRMRKRKEMRS